LELHTIVFVLDIDKIVFIILYAELFNDGKFKVIFQLSDFFGFGCLEIVSNF